MSQRASQDDGQRRAIWYMFSSFSLSVNVLGFACEVPIPASRALVDEQVLLQIFLGRLAGGKDALVASVLVVAGTRTHSFAAYGEVVRVVLLHLSQEVHLVVIAFDLG